jgi:hypothetical protein
MTTLLSFIMQATTAGVSPWFDPIAFGTYFGAFGGALVGLLGAFFGGVGSWAAQRGKWRRLMLGGMATCGTICALSLVAGIVAVTLGQPYGVWYPLTLIGLIGAGCFLGLLPTIRRRYAEAESRRMEAHALRHS